MLLVPIFLVISLPLLNCIKVIRTNPVEPLNKDGVAIIRNISLSSFDHLTFCVRVFTYQFDNTFSPYQFIISEPSKILGSFTGRNCQFHGCEKYFKDMIGEAWKFGKVFGSSITNNGYITFPSWKVNEWQSICVTVDKKREIFRVFKENELIFKRKKYKMKVEESDIILMNNAKDENLRSPIYGAITDFNVWKKILSRKKIAEWTNCSNTNVSDVL